MIEIPNFKFALREDLKDQKQFLPCRGEGKASGWDVAAALKDGANELVVEPGDWVKIPLGFRMFSPSGWWVELRPRSSTTAKKNIHALYGVIDELYEGELLFCGQYIPRFLDCPLKISFGEKIGQLIPVRRQEMLVEEVTNEEYDNFCKVRGGERGAGGFGSTSK